MVFVMERSHRNKVPKKFKPLLNHKKMVCRDIPDDYERMDPELIRILEHRVRKHIRVSLTMKIE
jgi:predicted protein tyrosine phosphatase